MTMTFRLVSMLPMLDRCGPGYEKWEVATVEARRDDRFERRWVAASAVLT